MTNKNYVYSIRHLLLILIFFIIIPVTALAKEPKQLPLTIIIREYPEARPLPQNIIKDLKALANELEKTSKSYDTANQKIYWENEASKSLLKFLRSEAYYDAVVNLEFPEDKHSIIVYLNGGDRYRIKKIQYIYTENSNHNIRMPDKAKLKIKEGDFAVASAVLTGQKILENEVEMNNCLLSIGITHQAVVNNGDYTVLVDYIINAGAYARVGSVDFTGLKAVDPEYLKKVTSLKSGQCFKPSLIKEAQGSLQKTGLFSVTTPEVGKNPDKNDEVPITFELKERKPRSVKAGLSYATDLGAGVTAGWNHRNFFGSGETVRTEVFANQREQNFELELTRPFFKRDDQTLKIGLSGEKTISKAFENKEVSVSVGVERKLSDIWTVGAGGKYSYAIVQDAVGTGRFSYLSVPLFATLDKKDNLLNPHKGYELIFKGEPFHTVRTSGKSFIKSEISGSKYFPFRTALDPVMALRVSVGSISGAELQNISANERFYVGGAQSVRGYASQLAGEIGDARRPIGGRSFIEASIELRTKIKGNIGLVTFFDSGNSFDSVTPRFNQKMFYGAGLGVRYFTDFGPLRLDVGFPLKRRKKIDRPFQVYFGIGQNF